MIEGFVCHAQLNRDLDFLGDHSVSTIIDDLDLLENVAVLIHRLSRVEDSVLDPSIVPPILQFELMDQSIETSVVTAFGEKDFADFDERAKVRNQMERLLDILLIRGRMEASLAAEARIRPVAVVSVRASPGRRNDMWVSCFPFGGCSSGAATAAGGIVQLHQLHNSGHDD